MSMLVSVRRSNIGPHLRAAASRAPIRSPVAGRAPSLIFKSSVLDAAPTVTLEAATTIPNVTVVESGGGRTCQARRRCGRSPRGLRARTVRTANGRGADNHYRAAVRTLFEIRTWVCRTYLSCSMVSRVRSTATRRACPTSSCAMAPRSTKSWLNRQSRNMR
jgi:hypothetical protein